MDALQRYFEALKKQGEFKAYEAYVGYLTYSLERVFDDLRMKGPRLAFETVFNWLHTLPPEVDKVIEETKAEVDKARAEAEKFSMRGIDDVVRKGMFNAKFEENLGRLCLNALRRAVRVLFEGGYIGKPRVPIEVESLYE